MKKQPSNPLVYIVQDRDKEVCGVWSTLTSARDAFVEASVHLLTPEGFNSYIEHQSISSTTDWEPKIIVCEINGNYVWSYDSLKEIDEAIKNGEKNEI